MLATGILMLCALHQLHARTVIKTLTVNNGGPWGDWHAPEYCGRNSYAVGYQLKIEKWQHSGDDTALNGVSLVCASPGGRHPVPTGDIFSGVMVWGSWGGPTWCHTGYITGFNLQVERWQGRRGDDTAANYMKVRCRDFDSTTGEYEMAASPGRGNWGSYGQWSASCLPNSAVCGIQTRIEGGQGRRDDDTALNDVRLFCCRRP